MANSTKNLEAEIASMKTVMAQLFQTVMGTKPKQQQYSEQSGMAKDTVAYSAQIGSRGSHIKAQTTQRTSSAHETGKRDDGHLRPDGSNNRLLDPAPLNHPGLTTHTNNFNHASGETRHHHPTDISTIEYPWFGEQIH